MQITEEAVRRLARREGYVVRKSRSRDPNALGFGGFMLIDPSTNFAMVGQTPFVYSADLEEIRDWLIGSGSEG